MVKLVLTARLAVWNSGVTCANEKLENDFLTICAVVSFGAPQPGRRRRRLAIARA